MIYAYVLLDWATKDALYVGEGAGNRYKDYGKHNKGMKSWTDLNGKPEYMLYPCKDRIESAAKEEELILKFGRKDLGTGTLFNESCGKGRKGCKLSSGEIAKRQATKTANNSHSGGRPKGYVVKQSTKDKISTKRKDQTFDQTTKDKMSDTAQNRTQFSCLNCKQVFKHARHFPACKI